MLRSMVTRLICISTLNLGTLALALGSPEGAQERLAACLDRLALVSPLDAGAHVALARWCQEHGLAAEARKAYERAIAIDADCAAARAALGYVRWGTGWRLAGASRRTAPAPGGRASGGSSGDPVSTSEPPRELATATKPRLDAAPEPGRATDIASVASRLEQKKDWAAEASERFGLSFVTYEDRDFLVHSTFSRRDREFRRLLDSLRGLRKLVAGVLGVRSRRVIWPDKLQIVLLRSEPEYDRFAQTIDGLQSARNPQGAYTKGDRTVVWSPDGEGLARAVGSTALRQLYDSGRPVGWWLEDGVAEMVVAGSPWGASRQHGERAFVEAARTLAEETDGALIFNLLETSTRRSDRDAALAMTLTQFLIKRSRRGFTELVRELKSDAAPAPPQEKEKLDSYLVDYVSFQDKALRRHFGATVPVIGERWKEYVVQTGKKLEKDMEEAEARRREEERRARLRGRYR